MAESTRGQHPDLIDDAPPAEPTAAATTPAPAPETTPPQTPPGGRDERGRFAAATASAPEAPSPESGADAQAAPDIDWWRQARETEDPKAALAILAKNLPRDEVTKDPTLAGMLGDLAQRRARALLEQQSRDQAELQRREALARGDYYQLGELTAPDLIQQEQERQAAQSASPFMEGVVAFQSSLPPEVQAQVQGRQWGVGKTYAEGVQEYMSAVNDALVSHRLNGAVETEIKKREPALRKALLSETVGQEQVPELDGGPAASVREITDEQIDRMSLTEYETYFDANGQPRPGTRVRLTRGIPINRR
jgi:hypothetical protein